MERRTIGIGVTIWLALAATAWAEGAAAEKASPAAPAAAPKAAPASTSKAAPPPELVRARERIDAIDRQLRDLLYERARIVQEIGEVKRKQGLPVRNPERERQVVEQLTAGPPGPLPAAAIARIWQQIFVEMRLVEEGPPGRAPR